MTSLFGGLEYLTKLQSNGATEMLQGLKTLSILKLALQLDLCWEHGLGNVSVKELATVLSNMSTLRNLSLCVDFGFSGIRGNSGVGELSEGLKSLLNLQQLQLELRWELKMNEYIDEGAQAIVNALKQVHGLKVLELLLKLNGSISKIASLFPFLPMLQELKLGWRHVHNKTNVSVLVNGIKHLKQLGRLDLSWSEISDKDITTLVDALKYLNVSTILDTHNLSHNKIGDVGLKLLANGIESGYLSHLQVLILSHNMFSDTGAETLSEKVVKLSKLRTFDLGLKQGRYSARAMTQIYQ